MGFVYAFGWKNVKNVKIGREILGGNRNLFVANRENAIKMIDKYIDLLYNVKNI